NLGGVADAAVGDAEVERLGGYCRAAHVAVDLHARAHDDVAVAEIADLDVPRLILERAGVERVALSQTELAVGLGLVGRRSAQVAPAAGDQADRVRVARQI